MGQRRDGRRSIPPVATPSDYLTRRVKPQTGQVATSVAGSTTRKLVQPLVLQ
jgi:hypothetical protein